MGPVIAMFVEGCAQALTTTADCEQRTADGWRDGKMAKMASMQPMRNPPPGWVGAKRTTAAMDGYALASTAGNLRQSVQRLGWACIGLRFGWCCFRFGFGFGFSSGVRVYVHYFLGFGLHYLRL